MRYRDTPTRCYNLNTIRCRDTPAIYDNLNAVSYIYVGTLQQYIYCITQGNNTYVDQVRLLIENNKF